MQVAINLLTGVVHIGKIAARNEGDLVPILLMIGNNQLLELPVIGALILKRKPTERPCHARTGPPLFHGFA